MTGLIFSPPELNTLRYLTSWPSYRLADSFLRRPGFSKTRPIWAFFPFSSDNVLPAPVDLSLWRLAVQGLLGWTWTLPAASSGRFPLSSLNHSLLRRLMGCWSPGARRRCPAFSAVSSPRRRARTGVAPPPCVLLPFFKSNYPTASLPFSNGDLGKFFFDGR